MAGDKRTVAPKPVMLAAGNATSGEGSPFQKAALVVNTRSLSGETAFDVAAQILPELGVPLAVTHALAEPGRLPEVVVGALRVCCDLIVVGGGDGSISCVVDMLAHHDAALRVLPVGTANDFTRTLGIPFEIELACETVASGALVDVVLGLVGGDYYVNVASVGLSAAVARSMASGLKSRLGTLAYPAATARAFVRHQSFSAHLTFPDGDYEPVELQSVLQLSVGNGRFYGGGCVVSPGSGIDDSMLDVYAIEDGPFRELFRVLRRLRGGAHVQSHLVSHFQTRSIHVETRPSMSSTSTARSQGARPRRSRSLRTHCGCSPLEARVPQGWTSQDEARRQASRRGHAHQRCEQLREPRTASHRDAEHRARYPQKLYTSSTHQRHTKHVITSQNDPSAK